MRGLAAQAQGACGKATVLVDFKGRAEAEDAGPPGALWGGAKDGAIFLLGAWPGGARRPGPCALALVGVAVEAGSGAPGVGAAEVGEGICGEERREAVLPVLMAARDFALGLRGG